ncbi:response regulator [uncultured Sutterella sp.]|uniref:response regulator transcription factor n=1 Tax=uncultured Sutterella sp. TaxID=286133 RepID=UPI002627FE46|nr:response regulator [uncultured Sutterella sp.]
MPLLPPLVRLVDDDEALLRAHSFVLNVAGMEVRTYSSGEEFLQFDDFARPGCVVLDVRMTGMSGLECQEVLRKRGIDLPVLFLTGHGDIDMALLAVKRGAADFLQKPVEAETLAEACRTLLEWHIEERTKKAELESLRRRVASLTPRELEVALQAAQGIPNKPAAAALGISEQAVRIHRMSIYRKLGIHSPVEILGKLRAAGLIAGESESRAFVTVRMLSPESAPDKDAGVGEESNSR